MDDPFTQSRINSRSENVHHCWQYSMYTFVSMHAKSMVQAIKSCYSKRNPRDCNKLTLIGRRSIFADPRAIRATGNIHHVAYLSNLIEEAVVVSPHKALFMRSTTAKDLSEALTGNPDLRKFSLQYRKSGPNGRKSDLTSSKPIDLAANLRAGKLNAIAARLPESQANLLETQINVEVLGIDGSVHENVPSMKISKICKTIF